MANIMRFGGGGKANNVMDLDNITKCVAESKLTGKLTGNSLANSSSYTVYVNGTKVFNVVDGALNLGIITKIKLACTSIDSYGLQGCMGLTSLDLPACTSIGDYALYGCTKLALINIGMAIQQIASSAFGGTSGLVININRKQGAISGAPWLAANATINWTGTT